MLRDVLYLYPVKVKYLTTGKNSWDDLMFLRSRQNKNRILRRFLQSFQKSIESLDGKHVNLINDIDFVIALLRRIPHLVHQCTDIIYRVVGSRIQLIDVKRAVGIECLAGIADIAGFYVLGQVFTIDGFCENSRAGSLPYPPGTTKKKGLGKVVILDCILQGGGNMLLPHHAFKIRRPIVPG